MSYYSQVVLEVKNDLFDRFMDYWKGQKSCEVYELRRPEKAYSVSADGCAYSYLFTYPDGWNHAPSAYELGDFLEDELGLDNSDYYLVVRGEGCAYSAEIDSKVQSFKDFSHSGSLSPSFLLRDPGEIGWFEEIYPISSRDLTEIQLNYRRDPVKKDVQSTLSDLVSVLSDIQYELSEIKCCLEELCSEKSAKIR